MEVERKAANENELHFILLQILSKAVSAHHRHDIRYGSLCLSLVANRLLYLLLRLAMGVA